MGGAEVTFGIIGVFILLVPILAAIVAIVTGVLARKQIARSDGALKGRGMALSGIIMGTISLLIAAGLTAFFVVAATTMQRRLNAAQPGGPGAMPFGVNGGPAPVPADLDVLDEQDAGAEAEFEEELVEEEDE